jgi:hypothetical protein
MWHVDAVAYNSSDPVEAAQTAAMWAALASFVGEGSAKRALA